MRETGDENTIRADFFVSIRTLGRHGPKANTAGEGAQAKVGDPHWEMALSPTERASILASHLDLLFIHLWQPIPRVLGEGTTDD
jgi:hypothetical protein